MNIINLLGVVSSITGIISFILYFVDKQNPSQKQGNPASDWRIWVGATMVLTALLVVKISNSEITGIKGNNNDNNEVIISPKQQ